MSPTDITENSKKAPHEKRKSRISVLSNKSNSKIGLKESDSDTKLIKLLTDNLKL